MLLTAKITHVLIGKSQTLAYKLKKISKKMVALVKDLREFNYPKPKRLLYENFCYFVNFPTYLSRKYLGFKLINQSKDNFFDSIPTKDGFIIEQNRSFEPLQEAITFAQKRLHQIDINELLKKAEGKQKYLMALPIKHELSLTSPLIKLALHPVLVKTVSEYMGILPILNSVNILYSSNQNLFEDSSQYFHLDPEGVKQIKIFIYLDEVTEEGGPFTLIPASESQKVYSVYKGGRLTDEFINQLVDKKHFTPITGPAGTMIFVDTSSCFHFGSRPGKKDRPAILLQYVSPFAMIFPRFGWSRKTRLAHLVQEDTSMLEKYLLGAK